MGARQRARDSAHLAPCARLAGRTRRGVQPRNGALRTGVARTARGKRLERHGGTLEPGRRTQSPAGGAPGIRPGNGPLRCADGWIRAGNVPVGDRSDLRSIEGSAAAGDRRGARCAARAVADAGTVYRCETGGVGTEPDATIGIRFRTWPTGYEPSPVLRRRPGRYANHDAL